MEKINTEELHRLIAEDKLEECLDLLMEIYNKNALLKEVVLQKRRFKALVAENRQGIISYEDSTLERNKIARAILDLIKELEQIEQLSPTRRKWHLFFDRYKILLGIATIVLLGFIGFIIKSKVDQRTHQATIKKLDREISDRIASIRITDWYRHALMEDSSSLNICSNLLTNSINDDFQGRTLKSLLIDLENNIPEKEKNAVKQALEILQDIESKYNDNFLINNPTYIARFYADVISMNKLRWVIYNHRDDQTLIEVSKEMEAIYDEIFY